MRNILNYVAYPIIDPSTKKMRDMMVFVDNELQEKLKLLAEEVDRDTYFRVLERDY